MSAKHIIETIRAVIKSMRCNYKKLKNELVQAEIISTCMTNILDTYKVSEDVEAVLPDGSKKIINVDKPSAKVCKVTLISIDMNEEVELICVGNTCRLQSKFILNYVNSKDSISFILEKDRPDCNTVKMLTGDNEVVVDVFNLLKYFPVRDVENIINAMTSSVRWLNEAKVY